MVTNKKMHQLIDELVDFTCENCYKRREAEKNHTDEDEFIEETCANCRLNEIV